MGPGCSQSPANPNYSADQLHLSLEDNNTEEEEDPQHQQQPQASTSGEPEEEEEPEETTMDCLTALQLAAQMSAAIRRDQQASGAAAQAELIRVSSNVSCTIRLPMKIYANFFK